MSHKFENLNAWQVAKRLAIAIYDITASYPDNEKFGLTSQTNRAAVSIPSNIAEGTSRQSSRDFSHFLDISLGSAFELETLIIIACDRNLIDIEAKTKIENLIVQTEKLINGLKRSLK